MEEELHVHVIELHEEVHVGGTGGKRECLRSKVPSAKHAYIDMYMYMYVLINVCVC